METLVQEVENRTILGKKVRSLRRSGITPANVFGRGVESVAIQVNTADLEALLSRAGGTRMITMKIPSYKRARRVLAREVQRNPITGKLLHVNFYQVSMKDKLTVEIPLVFEGEAPAYRRKDLVLLENLNSIEVECLPSDIPENISVDLSSLAEAGDSLMVGGLALSDKVTLLTPPDEVIAKVEHVRAAEVEEVEEEVVPEEAEVEARVEPVTETPATQQSEGQQS